MGLERLIASSKRGRGLVHRLGQFLSRRPPPTRQLHATSYHQGARFPRNARWRVHRTQQLHRYTVFEKAPDFVQNEGQDTISGPDMLEDGGLLEALEERGFVNQIVGERDDLRKILAENNHGVYVGLDPTADSLHVGHLLPLLALFWIFKAGHSTHIVVGGFTARIGDPTGRTTARIEMDEFNARNCTSKLKQHVGQITSRVRSSVTIKEDRVCEVLDNDDWLGKMKLPDFLKLVGFHTRMGALLGRDTVKNRLQNGDGMSVSEFLYPLLQASDWLHLRFKRSVQAQIGGADQFGNILSGLEAIDSFRRQSELGLTKTQRPAGFTVPLLTTSSGEKFGKSSGNAVWLDKSKCSPFTLYQFFLTIADRDVHRYLKIFTFDSLQDLQHLMDRHDVDRSQRVAQHHLAHSALCLVHGAMVADRARFEHVTLFRSGSSLKLSMIRNLADSNQNTPLPANATQAPIWSRSDTTSSSTSDRLSAVIDLPKSLIWQEPLSRVLHRAGLVKSRSEGERLCAEGGAYVGQLSKSIREAEEDDIQFVPSAKLDTNHMGDHVIGENLLLLRAGKRNVKLIKVLGDQIVQEQDSSGSGSIGSGKSA